MASMNARDRGQLSEQECAAVLARLFPRGLGGEDVIAELAPEGWERSPLLAVFHPSVEQVYRESLRFHRNLERLAGPRSSGPLPPEPTLEEIREQWHDEPVDRQREVPELVGRCLWDVISDNHDVIAPDGREVHLGSFRAAGDFIAELLDNEVGSRQYGYMDFYMGTIWINDRADLTPVYAMIFRRLATHGYDWEYAFPRIHAIDFGRDRDETADLADRLEQDRQRADLHTLLEEGHREALEIAKGRPPPATVDAYRQIYGEFPRGWPPWD
jgi:hypothetical protein